MGLFDKLKAKSDYNAEDIEFVDDTNAMEEEENTPSTQASMSINSSSIELKVIKPESFDCVKQIAEHLLGKRTVVLNLESTNRETARRIIDFLSGVAYSISGQIKRVANNTFVITPSNVDVSGDQIPNSATTETEIPRQVSRSGNLYSED